MHVPIADVPIAEASADESGDSGGWPARDPLPRMCLDKPLEGCGGDLVGTWRLIDMCRTEIGRKPGSGCIENRGGKLTMTGEMRFEANGQVVGTTRMRERVVEDFECSCLRGPDREQARELGGGLCRLVSGPRSDEDTDTMQYETDGPRLMLAGEPGIYCVDGDEARIRIDRLADRYILLERAE